MDEHAAAALDDGGGERRALVVVIDEENDRLGESGIGDAPAGDQKPALGKLRATRA